MYAQWHKLENAEDNVALMSMRLFLIGEKPYNTKYFCFFIVNHHASCLQQL